MCELNIALKQQKLSSKMKRLLINHLTMWQREAHGGAHCLTIWSLSNKLNWSSVLGSTPQVL